MDTASKARSMLEGFVRDGSFKWLLGKQTSIDEEFEEMGNSPSAKKNWIPELSPLANMVVRRCSKILSIPAPELQKRFNMEASESVKLPSCYVRNFVEYCCLQTLAVSVQVTDHLADKCFRRLTFYMMLAWEVPAASSQPLDNAEKDLTVGLEAFCRIAPAVPVIANVVISDNLFEVLTMSTDGRLQFPIYDKYITALDRTIKRMKSQSDSSLLSDARLPRREKILEVEGTVTTQPVLEHVGASTWPGRLTLTDHALYFEALRVVSYDKPKIYSLSHDLKQIVKPEITGPWGTRLFDRAVSYNSISLSEPVVMEFPELKGHSRRDYWLAIIKEILFVHRFINKYQITGFEQDEALSKAVLGILRVQAIQDILSLNSVRCENLLLFNLCDELPGGDLILETLANTSSSREVEYKSSYDAEGGIYSLSASAMISNMGLVFGTSSSDMHKATLSVGEITVGEVSLLEAAVKKSRTRHKKAVLAQETVAGAKVDGIDTNLAIMKELLLPVMEAGQWLSSLALWDDTLKSSLFCLISAIAIWREWLRYAFGMMVIFFAIFIVLTRFFNHGKPADLLNVLAPPPMNTMEQLLAVQNAISQVEQLIQDGNIFLLKFRALSLSIFPQATEKFGICLLCVGLILVFVPFKYIVLCTFLEAFTRYSPPRKAISERWARRLKEWWLSIPAAPVQLEREDEDKKKK